jgi:hypothetical protein
MVVCVESLIAESGTENIKLTQVLVTEMGAEPLDSFPWEDIGKAGLPTSH